MVREFVIKSPYGGLGDLLFLSHLPRIAKESGRFDKVFISTLSESRNSSYTDLIWKLNPYVDGFKPEDAPYPSFEAVPSGMNLLDRMMLERGLDDGLRFHEPEIYYKPQRLNEFADKSVYDPNFVSGVGDVSPDEVKTYISSQCSLDYQLKPREHSFPIWCGAELLETKSLTHYCDIIYACKNFFCLTSGGATLAAALKKPAIAFYGFGQKAMFHHSRLHTYVNVSSKPLSPQPTDTGDKVKEAPDISSEVSGFFNELTKSIAPADVKVILDLGSRDAKVAIAFRELLPAASIFAFECNPDGIALCKRNLKGRTDIQLVEMAVSDTSGTLDFYAIDPEKTTTPHADGNIGASSLFVAAPDYPMEKYVQRRITVPAITLADWLQTQQFKAIDVLWMDLQGAELKALRGLGDKIQSVKAIYAEVSFQRIYVEQPLIDEFEKFLLKNGFDRKTTLYADAWMGNVLYTRSVTNSLSPIQREVGNPSKNKANIRLAKVAVHCDWKPTGIVRYPELGIELHYSPERWDGFDYALDLDRPFSREVAGFPANRRMFATTEPSRFIEYTEDLTRRLENHYGALILSWHSQLSKIPHCKPWHAVEKWASPIETSEPKIFGMSGLISAKNVGALEGYALRRRILDSQDSITLPGIVYNFKKSWRGQAIPYPIQSKNDALKYMFHISIENCIESGYFTEKLLDAFVTRTVPLYFGDPTVSSVFDARGIIVLRPDRLVEQLNELTEDDYLSRLPYINENFERSKHFWNLDLNLARAIAKELKLMPPATQVTVSSDAGALQTPVVAGSVSPTKSLTEVNPDSEFSRAIKELFRAISPGKIIETGTFLGTGTTHIIAQTIRELGLRDVTFKTIECNPLNAQQARANLMRAGLDRFVEVINGLTLPRSMLPSLSEIEQEYTKKKFEDQIFVDHAEQHRASLYHQETEFPNIPDDVLGQCMKTFHNRPDFVLLDSAGHVGNIEFNYFIEQLEAPCVIALDDVFHVKHHKSLKQIQGDSRFNVLLLSREKFGFCITAFSPQRLPDAEDVKQLVWVRSDAIGDNVLASSMLPAVRKRFSSARITVVCDSRNTNLYQACPFIDEIIDFDRNQLQGDQSAQRLLSERLAALKADLCLNSIFSPEPLTDFLVMSCRARDSVGFRVSLDNMIPEFREQHNKIHSKLVPAFPLNVTEMDRHQQFLTGIGIDVLQPLRPLVWTDQMDEDFADSFFRGNDFDPERTVVFFAGAQSEKKQYFNYGKALKNFCRENNFSVVALGSKGDSNLNQINLDELDCRSVNLSGLTSLRQGAAIIRRCRLAVGADTGLAHIACAVDVPLVVLLGGGHYGRFFPYSPNTSVVSLPLDCFGCGWQCKFQEPHCITGISTNVLAEAISQTYQTKSTKPRIFVSEKSVWQPLADRPEWSWPNEMIAKGSCEIIEVEDPCSPLQESTNATQSASDPETFDRNEFEVSICIITNSGLEKNTTRRLHLERLLSSIATAGFPAATEVIICGAVGKRYGNATILEKTEWAAEGQVCALRNSAIRAARGRWIIHCDDDILFTPGYWQSVQSHLNEDSDILCTRLLNPNGTRYWDWAAFYPGKGQTLLPYNVKDPSVYATGGHAVYRRNIFRNVRWNEAIRHGGNEEFDFAAQARQNNLKFGLCSKATVFLQYHHCDAEAVIRQQPQAPNNPCSSFLSALASIGVIYNSSTMEKLQKRLGHKLSPGILTTSDNENGIKVSILVCCHRFLQRFRVFVRSLCEQDFELSNVELVVSNPHSPDGLSEFLRLMAEACASQRNAGLRAPHIKELLIDPSQFRNRGYLIQQAFKASSGKIVIGMDVDVVMPINFLKEISDAVALEPDTLIGVYRNFLTADTTAKILVGFIDPVDQFQQLLSEDVEEPHGYRGVLGYCQAVLRTHWAKVNYPVEYDQIDRSDVDFVERLRAAGVPPSFLKTVRLLHLHHPRDWMGTDKFL